MKRFRYQYIFLFLIFFFIKYISAQTVECFSIVAGKDATVDGSVLMAHNEDDTVPQTVNWYKVPRFQHKPDETVTLKNGAQIPQTPETWSYLWLQMPGMDFSDSYLNEWGVCIASDACRSKEKNGELTEGGIGYWLRRLMAERAKSARDAVKIGSQFVEALGYHSSGRSYVIADPNEAWVMSVIQGKHWVAQRIPDDQVMVIPNYYTIAQINLADTINFLGSADIISYAESQGWYNPEADGEFSFRDAYGLPESQNSPENIHRKWRGVNLLAEKQDAMDNEFPFSFVPGKKLSLKDLIAVLRDHYEGTELDRTENYKNGSPNLMNSSTICAFHNQYGFVTQLRNWLPIEIGCVMWLAPRRPDVQAFIPWYSGIEKIPDGFFAGDYKSAIQTHFSSSKEEHSNLAFPQFSRLAEKVDQNYEALFPIVREQQDSLEHHLLEQQAGFE